MAAKSPSHPSESSWTQLRALTAALVQTSPRKIAGSALLTIGLSVTEGLGVLMLIPLLSLVGVAVEAGTAQSVVSAFARGFSAVGVRPTLGGVLTLYVLIITLQSVMQRVQTTVGASVQEELVTKLRARLYHAISHAEWGFLATSRASDYTHALITETSRVGGAAKKLIDLTMLSVVALVYLALAFRLLPAMATIVVLASAVLGWAIRGSIYDARTSARQVAATRKKLQAMMIDHLGSMKTAKSYGLTHRHEQMFLQLSGDLRAFNMRAVGDARTLQYRLSIGQTVLLAAIVYVSHEILAVPTTQLLVLLFLYARLMPRITHLYSHVQSLVVTLPAFDDVLEIEKRCLAAAEPPSEHDRSVELRERVQLESVTYAYRGATSFPAIRDVDLEFRAGTTTAVVGPSGAGKTTVADVLIGLLPPTRGSVLIDGQPLGPEDMAAWRNQLAYVSQDTFMFHDTIRENLLWAKPDATDADLWNALRLAAADEFVAALPNGLDTIVGDRGVLISGGERQRLSLARALVRQPAVLILDEATSSLDSENELRIQRAIAALHRRMTIVIITHRLSTIKDADIIHVLDSGRVVESGTWDELVVRPAGRFRELQLAQGIDDRQASPHRELRVIDAPRVMR